MNNSYVLEVVEFITEKDGDNGWLKLGGNYKHIGYMNAMFKTKEDAVSYYDKHNPHLRSLNAHNTYISDWDPETKLLYIVREDKDIISTIPPFSKEDLPIIIDDGNSVKYEHKWLK